MSKKYKLKATVWIDIVAFFSAVKNSYYRHPFFLMDYNFKLIKIKNILIISYLYIIVY